MFIFPYGQSLRQKHIYAFSLTFTVVFFVIFFIYLQSYGTRSIIRTINLSPENIQACGAVLIKTSNDANVQDGVAFDAETQNRFLEYLKSTQCTVAQESPFMPVSDYRYYVYFEQNNGKHITVFFTSSGYMSFKGTSYKLIMAEDENILDFLSAYTQQQ